MKCPVCIEINQESTVVQLQGTNISRRRIYRCSEDHCFEVTGPRSQPAVSAWVPEGNWATMAPGSQRQRFDPLIVEAMSNHT